MTSLDLDEENDSELSSVDYSILRSNFDGVECVSSDSGESDTVRKSVIRTRNKLKMSIEEEETYKSSNNTKMNIKPKNIDRNMAYVEDIVNTTEEENINESDENIGLELNSNSHNNENDDSEDAEKRSNKEGEDIRKLSSNPHWADAISKILKTNKPKNKKTLVLSRAKKINDVKVKKENLDFEVVSNEERDKSDEEDVKEKKPDIKSGFLLRESHMKGRIKPSILDKDRERTLSKIATRGVVQLFNVVRQQQKTIDYKLQRVGKSRRKKERVLETIDKKKSLATMISSIKSTPINEIPVKRKKTYDEKPTWDVLRENFMMGNKLKDWDKKEDNDDEVENKD